MRIIPKKMRIKNAVWKCYSLPEIIAALALFAMIFASITLGNYVFAAIVGVLTIVMLIPTPDGVFYTYIIENVKFLFAKKKYTKTSKSAKENVDALCDIINIKPSGVIEYRGGMLGRAIKLGQKNFGIEDEYQQDADIECFARALKQLDGTQSADIVKIDRPVTLDSFSLDLFDKLNAVKDCDDEEQVKEIKTNILRERIDRIDALNNMDKRYLSEFYIVVYGRNETELENTAINIAADINKCGIFAKILGGEETAVFVKYGFSRNFDERDVKNIPPENYADWVKPNSVEFKANRYVIDGTEASIMAIADYPLRVRNAWGAQLFHIPNTKVVLHIKPVDKYKAIKRIDKCISEMETKRIMSEKASDATSAETHIDSMQELLNSLQTENETLLDTTLTVTAYNYDNDPEYKRKVRRAVISNNFRPSTLYGLQIQGFTCSCVSPVRALKNYERGINSGSLAAVFPFVRTNVMDENGIQLGESRNGDPFMLDLWKRGELYQNSNGFVIGKSGSGKSFFLKNLIANEWANGTRVIICDPEAEYVSLAKNLCGNVINVGNAKEGRINPFHIYRVLGEDGRPADSKVTFNTHLKTLESFFKIVLDGAGSDVIEYINNLAVKAYAAKHITENTDFSSLMPENYPTFTNLLYIIRSEEDLVSDRIVKSAEMYIQKFVDGRYKDIWNAPSTLVSDTGITDFDFQSLFTQKNNVVANAQMLLVFRYMEQEVINAREANRSGNGERTLIVADEAHLFIDPKFPIALDFFYQMSKRIRKYGGSFVAATQNISDWCATDELKGKTSAVIKNAQYNFIFKLSGPDMQDVLEVYRAGDGFNDEEQKIIISAVTGQAFFVGSTELRTLVNIKSGEYVRSLFDEQITKSSKEDIHDTNG